MVVMETDAILMLASCVISISASRLGSVYELLLLIPRADSNSMSSDSGAVILLMEMEDFAVNLKIC